MTDTKKIVFVCTHNAGKSRLAEAYLNKVSGGRFEAVSAGTEPGDSANPAAVEAAAAAEITVPPGPGVALTGETVAGADLIVTFGCDVGHLGAEVATEDWALSDEDGQPLKDYNDVRDAITQRVDELMERL